MKAIYILVIIVLGLTAFACNNHQGKKAKENITTIRKSLPSESITKKIDKTESNKRKECENLITEILTTSPRYKQLTKGLYKAVVKNGGQSFGFTLEGSPNSDQNKSKYFSKTYDFSVYEVYTDRQLHIASFSFDPKNKQLYEYDVTLDQLKPIAFDKSLIVKFETLCN